MKKTWWLIPCLLVVLALGAVGCTQVVTSPSAQQNTGIWVTGQGEIMAVPDVVSLRLGVEAQASTVSEAQAQATEAMNKVMQALKANNVTEKDIQTQRFSINPVTRWTKEDGEEIIGYRVSNIVVAKIREIDKAGALIDAVAEAGGDYTRIQDISFTVDDPTPYYEEARSEAVENAKNKAMQLAASAGIQLGKPTYISEGAACWPPYTRDYEAGGAPGAPISPGELKITVTVQIVYEII